MIIFTAEYNELKISNLSIIKYFLTSPDKKATKKRKGLSGNYLYDSANLYSGLLKNKLSFISPGTENAPREVKNIHDSHFGKIYK